jgi:multidrug efflux system membrane fusion protein
LLVVDRALGTDQGLKYLYVVDADNKVQYRRVTVGALQEDGLRVIETGLEPDELVVVSGLQFVRPRMTVKTEETPMPIVKPARQDDGQIDPGLEETSDDVASNSR